MACAFGKGVEVQTILPDDDEKSDVILFLESNKRRVKRFLQKKLKESKAIKWYLTLQVKFVKINQSNNYIEAQPYFRNRCVTSFHKSELNKQISSAFASLLNKFALWIRDSSGWILEEVLRLDVNVGRFQPLKGKSYFKLPNHLKKKRAVINIQNKDDFCFLWCVLAALYPAKIHPERVSHYKKFLKNLDISGISFPIQVNDVSKFERRNNVCINVYEYNKNDVFPLYISKMKNVQNKKKIHLLLIRYGNKQHYCLIKSLSRLFREQTGCTNKRFYCDFCLHGFTAERLLQEHNYLCKKQDPQKVRLPQGDKAFLEFKNYFKQERIKFVIYCDFESLLVPVQGCDPDPAKHSSTTTKHIHTPCAFSYVVVSSLENYISTPIVYRGVDAVERFVYCMLEEEDKILDELFRYRPLEMSDNDWEIFINSTMCHICGKEVKEEDLRVRDHEHHSGRFRGLAHADCNLRFKKTKRIPIVFHNLKNYDGHLIMQAIGKVGKEKITCIPTNMEKYLSFTLGKHLIFVDSFQFLASSLQTLVNNLAHEGTEKFKLLSENIEDIDTNLLVRKQVYPYEYMDSWDRFYETSLPSSEKFYSTLTEEAISNEDYEHAKLIWDVGKFKNLGEMCDFYVKTDTLLLACVFENFRHLCLDYYGLDPLHYVSLPGLTFDACLKYTGIKIELLTDIDKYLFFESGIRGGISGVSTRYAKANNPYVKDYDPKKPTTYINFYDCNGLYAWALSQPLPTGNFNWLDENEIESLDICKLGGDGCGYVLEVDLIYPHKLHDLHNLYPLAPEKMRVTKEMLSPFLVELLAKHSIKHSDKTEKLIPNLYDKERYIVHYRALQLYLQLGLKIKKIHRVISFDESSWIEPYVRFNTEKRREAKNVFEQDMFKLMLNAFFGKCMENVRKRINVDLVTEKKKLVKSVSKPTFDSFKIFNKKLVGVHMKKTHVVLDKPIFIGFSILDISKMLMYDFYYNYLVNKYGKNVRLLLTDTDSACTVTKTKNVHNDMSDDLELFDTSNYPKNHLLYCLERMKALGYFKDEMGGKPIVEFVGLRSKMYSICTDDTNKKAAKGVKKTTINKHLKHEQYLHALKEGKRYSHKMMSIRSKNHVIYTCDYKKTSICPMDDKRYILRDGINTLAYGHHRIQTLSKRNKNVK